MLVSMTGFGFGHYEDKSVSIDVEIRSFNSRYFELQTRYFDLSGETEYKIRKFLKEKLKRGSVTLSIKIDSKNRFKVNNHKIESFLKAYRDIEKKYNLKLDYSQLFSSSDLVRFSTSNKVFDNKISNSLITKSKVVEKIKKIFDPEIPINIYDLGLIYYLDIDKNNNILIKMTLTSPMCPVAESLPPEVESKVRDVPGVKAASVEVVWDPPWSMEQMSEAAKLQLGLL